MSGPISFAERVRSERRLAILRLLSATATHPAADTLLHRALPDMGLASSLDAVRADCAWLEEQGLVEQTNTAGVTRLVQVTSRGMDVASGVSHVPGVAAPRPED